MRAGFCALHVIAAGVLREFTRTNIRGSRWPMPAPEWGERQIIRIRMSLPFARQRA